MIDCENVSLEEGSLDAIMLASGGDMRKALTFLQSCAQFSGGLPISPEIVSDMSGMVIFNNIIIILKKR